VPYILKLWVNWKLSTYHGPYFHHLGGIMCVFLRLVSSKGNRVRVGRRWGRGALTLSRYEGSSERGRERSNDCRTDGIHEEDVRVKDRKIGCKVQGSRKCGRGA
jgi:hypothetical protein